MASRRRPVRRVLLLLLLVAIVWLLLQFNRFLPGWWPGGGSDKGVKPVPSGARPVPPGANPSTAPPPPSPPRKDVVRVVVRSADGLSVPAVELVMGDGTATPDTATGVADLPLGKAGTRLDVYRGAAPDRRRMTHVLPRNAAGKAWIVPWPQGEVPAVAPGTERTVAEVVVRADGKPVAGATVHVESGSGDAQATTDAEGKAHADGVSGPFRARATAAGRAVTAAYGSTVAPGPLVLDLDALREVTTRFEDPETHEPVEARALRIVSLDGTTRTLERPSGGYRELRMNVPARVAAGQALEVEAEGRPLVRVPLDRVAAVTAVPKGRRVTVLVGGKVGGREEPIRGARVEARYGVPPGREPGPFPEPVTAGEYDPAPPAGPTLPADRPTDLVVTAPGYAPAVARVEPGGDAKATVSMPRGVLVVVEVVDENGKPMAGADVIVLSRAGDVTVRRTAKTGADGLATTEPVNPGRVEVYAHAPGRTWEWGVAQAGGGPESPRARLQLVPGHRLHLVVEDPYGVPLAGVRVRAEPAASSSVGHGPTADPDAPPWVTNVDGVLVVEDVPWGFVLRLSKEGYGDEEIDEVRPDDGTLLATMVPRK